MNAAGFTLRPLVPADLPGLTDLWVRAWEGAGLAVDFNARREWFAAHIAGLAAKCAEVIVAEDGDNGLGGFVTIDPVAGRLDQLCVAPASQGRGLARLLLNAARVRAPGAIRLEVNADNARALQLYRREGFVETGAGVSPASGLQTISMEWRRG